MTRPGSHTPTIQPVPECPGCKQPMTNTRTGVFQCYCTGEPHHLAWLDLKPAKPTRRQPPKPGPFGPIHYREPGDRTRRTSGGAYLGIENLP